MLRNPSIREPLKVGLYELARLRNLLLRPFKKRASTHTFLFILCPPFSGSTLLNELLSTSPAVICNNEVSITTREGQMIPRVKKVMRDTPWDPKKQMPWASIKKTWMDYWDLSFPVLLEKSPPNLLRVAEIKRNFQPVRFLAMIRNPYAFCESHMRRKGMTATEAAKFWVLSAQYQQRNIENETLVFFRYEDLVTDPVEIKKKIIDYLPELESIDVSKSFSKHNSEGKRSHITDFNKGKIEKLSDQQLSAINAVLLQYPKLLGYFKYELVNL